ncbi:ATP-binding protein [Mucilaginibacter sp. AK015]|uniref:ATP-binding protein n=1 Tax=Mucilaginibacter sp. AK015 TaxID=2723072 RepID=UPI00184A0E00|nr:ATP-binding protein [Mucilaginibacter sp. AK015]MBB5395132.1 DNA mismatch repair ATPase MutL [Mucilaginibacter sp. AK015]
MVANAWDAGATQVKILIPEDYHKKLIASDNGSGLSKDQFEQRSMKLDYNRLKHQGKNVLFCQG